MFGLFKRNRIEEWETLMLINIFKALPDIFKKYRMQIEDGLIKGVIIGSSVRKNYIGFTYNPIIASKYEEKNGRFFELSGINVFDFLSKKYIGVNLYITHGLIMGYSVPSSSNYKLNHQDIQITNLFKKKFIYSNGADIFCNIFEEDLLPLVNPDDIYIVEIAGKVYYHLFDIKNGDGDFIGFDDNKNIFIFTHDPYEINTINLPLEEIVLKWGI